MKSKFVCPECSKNFDHKGKYFPFCSDRCKLLDLGAWASEKYRISVKLSDQSDAAQPSRHEPDSDE